MKLGTCSPFLILVGLILAVSLACSPFPAAQPTATPPRPPTQRPPTRAPATEAPTPDYLATQRAGAEAAVTSQLEELGLSTSSGYLAWVQDEPTEISLTGPGGQYMTFAESVNAADFVIYTEITWDTNSWPDCGLYFRADDKYADGDYYWLRFLRFSGLPAFDIEYYRDGQPKTIVTEKVRFSDHLDISDGATNVIVLSAVGNRFDIFINGFSEGRYYDYSSYLSQGYFAFLAYQDSGDTVCTFQNTWIWLY